MLYEVITNFGLAQRHLLDVLEKGDVFGVGTRPSAFDVVNPQVIQQLGDPDFIRH